MYNDAVMYNGAFPCTVMYSDAFPCTVMYNDAFPCTVMYNAFPCTSSCDVQ